MFGGLAGRSRFTVGLTATAGRETHRSVLQRWHSILGWAACLFGLGGCGGGDQQQVLPDLTALPDLSGDLKAPDYPTGPFGPDIGNVLPDFTFQGYWAPDGTEANSTTMPFGEVNFDMVRAAPGKRYAMVMLAAYW